MKSLLRRWMIPWLALTLSWAAGESAWAQTAQERPRTRADATPATTFTEDEILVRWLRESPEVASWRLQIGAARFDVVTAGLWRNPEIAISANALLAGAPPDGRSGEQVQLTMETPIFGQVAARRDAALAQVSVAEVTVASLVWSRAADIKNAMVDRAFADARLTMLKNNLAELDRIERLVSSRATAGADSRYDILRVSTSTATLRAAVNTAIIERDRAEASILALVADPKLQGVGITRDGITAFRGPEDEAALTALALAHRPDIELARRGVVAGEMAEKRYRREAIPTPSLFVAGYAVQGQYGFQVTGGISFPIPIFDRNQGQIGRAQKEAEGQRQLVLALDARVRAEVAGSWRARKSAQSALADFRGSTLVDAKELLHRAEVTYQAAVFSIAELLDAYQAMWDARSQELDLERQAAMAEADLERAAVLLPELD